MIQGKNDIEQPLKKKKITMAMNYANGNFPANLSILKGDNHENWCKQMNVIFCFQGLWDLVKHGIKPLDEDASEEEEVTYR